MPLEREHIINDPASPASDAEENEGELVNAQVISSGEEVISDDEDHFDFPLSDEGDDDVSDAQNSDQLDEFEDAEEEMSLNRVGLHDLNTLRHLYRFGLIKVTERSTPQTLS